MTPQKRNVVTASPADSSNDSSNESPHKRARSASNTNTINKQIKKKHSPRGSADDSAKHSILVAKASSVPQAALGKEDEAALTTDLPRTWDQASVWDKKLVELKNPSAKRSWTAIEGFWERWTGEKSTKGVLKGRYEHLKDIKARAKNKTELNTDSQIFEKSVETSNDVPTPHTEQVGSLSPVTSEPFNNSPHAASQSSTSAAKLSAITRGSKGTGTNKGPLKDSNQATSRREKTAIKTSRKRKMKAEFLDESLDETSDESSDQSSDAVSKHTITTARRKPRGAVHEHIKVSTSDGPSDGSTVKRMKLSAKKPSGGMTEAAFSNESDETARPSPAVAKSAKRPHAQPAVAAGARNTAETPNEMLVEMKERGCNWDEISQAWTERTGLTHAPDTLRRRYRSIKQGTAKELHPITSALSKRRVKAACPDENFGESSMTRGKSMTEASRLAETPIKRNMDRGKRKRSVKYTDATTDEDEQYAESAEPTTSAPSSAKRRAGRAAKVDRSDPEWLVTNEKSPLAYEDLYAEFSNPKTYENFTKSDWEDLRETLPPNVPVDDDGYSIPIKFFKHDPDFRRGIREFQEDLGSGHLDPKWQADAAQAMEERARGDFDAYKENQYEAFWGQKQKLSHDVLAGESTKIKLDLLIQNEVFKVGDYFNFSRVIIRRENRVLIEKDCKVVKLDNKALTFAIPPGQRKYSRHMFASGTSGDTKAEAIEVMAGGDGEPLLNGIGKPGTAQDTQLGPIENIDDSDSTDTTNSVGTRLQPNNKRPENETLTSTASKVREAKGASAQTNGGHLSTPANEEEDIIHCISSLQQLENRIVEIDGRLTPKELPNGNAWKVFRGVRKNQDLGSLFEMREDFFVYKYPQIVKEAKRKR